MSRKRTGYWAKIMEGRLEGQQFAALSPTARFFLSWLPHCSRSLHAQANLEPGLVDVNPSLIALMTGYDTTEITAALVELQNKGWIDWDPELQLVLIPRFVPGLLRFDPLKVFLKLSVEKLYDIPITREYVTCVMKATADLWFHWTMEEKRKVVARRDLWEPFFAHFPGLETECRALFHKLGVYVSSRSRDAEGAHVTSSSSVLCSSPPLLLGDVLHPEGEAFVVGWSYGLDLFKHRFVFSAAEALKLGSEQSANPKVTGVYWGLAEMQRPKKGRGKEEDVLSVRATWIDIDAVDENEDRDPQLALEGLDHYVAAGRVPAPSAIVASGGGAHAYYFLAEPATGDDLQLLKKVNLELAERVGGDHCHDLTRMLRMPGTVNRKYGDEPVVEVLGVNATRRYELAELAKFLKVDPEANSRIFSPIHSDYALSGTLPGDWTETLDSNTILKGLWDGSHVPTSDTSASGRGMALIHQAIRLGYTEPVSLFAIVEQAPSCGDWAQRKPDAVQYSIAKALTTREG